MTAGANGKWVDKERRWRGEGRGWGPPMNKGSKGDTIRKKKKDKQRKKEIKEEEKKLERERERKNEKEGEEEEEEEE